MKINVGVVYGGESVEHEISVISAMQGMKALDENRYNVVPIYISKTRELYSAKSLLDMSIYKDLAHLERTVPQVVLYKEQQKVYLRPLNKKLFQKDERIEIDVIIPIIHGTNGEDGTIQGYLELLGIPYSGCNVVGAAVGQDKVIMKQVLEHSKIAICDWTWFYYHDFEVNKETILKDVESIGYPLIVKPACLGSSIGISLANNEEELISAIDEAGQYDFKIVVEKAITNLVEINCAVLGDQFSSQASILEEVVKNDEILSYADKYQGNGKGSKGMASTERIVPANISDAQTEVIRELALQVFKVLGASGVSRIDFMIDKDTNKLYVNEINTIPGSLSFYLWEPLGISFEQLMDTLIKQAIDRKRRQEKMIFSYDTNILAYYKACGSKGVKQ